MKVEVPVPVADPAPVEPEKKPLLPPLNLMNTGYGNIKLPTFGTVPQPAAAAQATVPPPTVTPAPAKQGRIVPKRRVVKGPDGKPMIVVEQPKQPDGQSE